MDGKKILLKKKEAELELLKKEILTLQREIIQEECPFKENDIIEYCGYKVVFKGFYLQGNFYRPECYRIKKDGTLYSKNTWISEYQFNEREVVGVYK